MAKQYLQTQDIFNKVFQNNTGTLRAGAYNSTQDYLNAVYDPVRDALRIKFEGGVPGATLTPEQQEAIDWLVSNLEAMKEMTAYDYVVHVEEIALSGSTFVNVQGTPQNIDDDGNKDGDEPTLYRIDINGYVLGVETYSNNEATTSDRYYTKITYEATTGATGTSHIYLEQEEYDYFASLNESKNILKVFYVANVFPGKVGIAKQSITLPSTSLTPVYLDENNKDGDEATLYRIDVAGYVLDIEGYYSNEDIQKQRFMTKMSYDSESNLTSIYFTAEEYNTISSLEGDKNTVDIFYLAQK